MEATENIESKCESCTMYEGVLCGHGVAYDQQQEEIEIIVINCPDYEEDNGEPVGESACSSCDFLRRFAATRHSPAEAECRNGLDAPEPGRHCPGYEADGYCADMKADTAYEATK